MIGLGSLLQIAMPISGQVMLHRRMRDRLRKALLWVNKQTLSSLDLQIQIGIKHLHREYRLSL